MLLIFALLAAMPACIVWVWKQRLVAALVVWAACIAEILVWFCWATALPLEMLLPMQGFLIFVAWWTWYSFYRQPPQRKPLPQIVLSQPSPPTLFGSIKAAWALRISPWLALLALVGTGAYLLMAWLSGVPTVVPSPFDQTRSTQAMQRNQSYVISPAPDYQRTQAQENRPQRQPKNWVETDDLSDWGNYVKP